MIRFFFRLILFATLTLVAVELFFRTVVPASITAFRTHDPEFGILLYDTSAMRDGIYTTGRWSQLKQPWHVNNCGWKSSREYLPPSPNRPPLIGLIGDSYIVGFHLKEQDHLSMQLQNKLNGKYLVYTFGEGGAPLSQFLQIVRYAVKNFDPEIFIISVGDNDWKTSITNYYPSPRDHQITYKDGKFSEAPFSYHDGAMKTRLPKYSALIRYLTYNADYEVTSGLYRDPPSLPPTPEQKKAKQTKIEKILDESAKYYIDRLATEFPNKKFVFIVDGQRSLIYSGKEGISQNSVERLKRVCRPPQFYVLDLAPVEKASFAKDHQPFDFSFDYHWNEHGHRVIAEAVADFLK